MSVVMPAQQQVWTRTGQRGTGQLSRSGKQSGTVAPSPSASRLDTFRAYETKTRSKVLENSRSDIERSLSIWGDTVLRLAQCKTRNRADAEDITQTVFMKLCERKAPFDSDEHRKAWLLRVTLTCATDVQRDPWNKRCTGLDGTDKAFESLIQRQEAAASAATSAAGYTNSESVLTETLVTEAVASLPEKQRLAVHLYYYEEYSIREIALITGENPSTVRSHLHRGRASLKVLIGGQNG